MARKPSALGELFGRLPGGDPEEEESRSNGTPSPTSPPKHRRNGLREVDAELGGRVDEIPAWHPEDGMGRRHRDAPYTQRSFYAHNDIWELYQIVRNLRKEKRDTSELLEDLLRYWIKHGDP